MLRKQSCIFCGIWEGKIAPSWRMAGWCSGKSIAKSCWLNQNSWVLEIPKCHRLVFQHFHGFSIFFSSSPALVCEPQELPLCEKRIFFLINAHFLNICSSLLFFRQKNLRSFVRGPRMLPLLPSWAQPKALEVFRFAHYAFKLGGRER